MLVATDVAAARAAYTKRGHVFNCDLPQDLGTMCIAWSYRSRGEPADMPSVLPAKTTPFRSWILRSTSATR